MSKKRPEQRTEPVWQAVGAPGEEEPRPPEFVLRYQVHYSPLPGGRTQVTFPDFPEVCTALKSETATMYVGDVLEEAIIQRFSDKKPIPRQTESVGGTWIELGLLGDYLPFHPKLLQHLLALDVAGEITLKCPRPPENAAERDAGNVAQTHDGTVAPNGDAKYFEISDRPVPVRAVPGPWGFELLKFANHDEAWIWSAEGDALAQMPTSFLRHEETSAVYLGERCQSFRGQSRVTV